MADADQIERDTEGGSPDWGPDAPRGARAVMNRILKENSTVPLFFAQTLIQSLRDVGYNHTTSALCEHIDNAIQAEATEVRVFFRQSGKRGEYQIDAGVYDNGNGMPPPVLKVAMAFGGSMSYGNRKGIARFGMGMKTAALSMSPVLDVYSWQEQRAIYNMTLDVEAIGRERANLVELPEPTLVTDLPDDVADLLRRPMSYPSDREDQHIFADAESDLWDGLGRSGTFVYMPECDRLTYAKAKTLVDHAVKETARVYRRAISSGLHLYINNRKVEAFDPTYSMADARHARFLDDVTKQSRLITSKVARIRVHENSPETEPVTIKLYRLPIEDWSSLSRKTLRNDLRVFDGMTVSILRNDRELFAGEMPDLTTRHSVTRWYRVQIDFPGELDEAFGVSANKQGVRPKGYVLDMIKETIGPDITTINDELKRFQSAQASARPPAQSSTSEIRASEADPFQQTTLSSELSPDEEAQLNANLQGLAVSLRRNGETDEQAFERVKSSKYIIDFRHDEYWPFYDVKHRYGRIILTLNTAHPFFTELYDPVTKLTQEGASSNGDDHTGAEVQPQEGPIVALDLLLLSLARTQSRLARTGDEAEKLLDLLRREWSEAYRVQMTA